MPTNSVTAKPVLPTDINAIEVVQPDGALERARFQQQLAQIGVEKPARCAIIVKEDVEAYIKGGFGALVDAARTSGKPGVIDGRDLDAVTPQAKGPVMAALRFLHVVPEANVRGNQRIERLVTACDDAVAAIRLLGQVQTPENFIGLVAGVNAVADQIRGALANGTLGAADRAAFDELRPALTRFAEQFFAIKKIALPPGLAFYGDYATAVDAWPNNMAYLSEKVQDLLGVHLFEFRYGPSKNDE